MDKKAWAIPLTLAAMTLLTSSLLYFSERATHKQIEEQKRQKLLRSLQTIAPPSRYDNDLLASAQSLYEPQALGHRQTRLFYRGYQQGKLSLIVLPVTARKGYSGDIRLLVAIDPANATIIGTRILEHHETPGLGDQIEPEKTPWLMQFVGKSLEKPPAQQWKVRKDGGAFDQITGATITPRAVVTALRQALQYAEQHQQEWQNRPIPSGPETNTKNNTQPAAPTNVKPQSP